jgi:guanosine-3',5'-bis(diphosphate) 3'-pyrophosphohydrolase
MFMLFLSPTIKTALYFSAEAHDGQYRKGGKVPYIAHPVLVALLVSELISDEEIISAALLHDVMEDCGITETTLKEKFGKRVAGLVREVSNLEEGDGSWRQKKEKYIQSMSTISSDALLIIACDKMVNMKSYFEALSANPDKVSALFSGTPADYVWYYQSVENILKEKLGGSEAERAYSDLFTKCKGAVELAP